MYIIGPSRGSCLEEGNKPKSRGKKIQRERKLAPPEGPARRMGNVSVLRCSCEFLGLFRLRLRRIRARVPGLLSAAAPARLVAGSERGGLLGRRGMRFPEAWLALGRVCSGAGTDPSPSMDARGIPEHPAPSRGSLGCPAPIQGCWGCLAPIRGYLGYPRLLFPAGFSSSPLTSTAAIPN